MLIRSSKELAILIGNQRKKLKLTQVEVGDLVGLRQKTISAFENKPGSTQLDTVFKILSALNLDIKLSSKSALPETESKWKEEW